MIRKAFKMKIHDGKLAEYTQRHNPIWDELQSVLIEHGVHNYSIFHDEETNYLFAYAEIESEARWSAIASTEVCQKWWSHMGELMATNADNSPVSTDLNEVFHLA